MRKSILFLLVMLVFALFVPQVHAQTSVLVGVSGMNAFNNLSAGVTAGLNVPFLHRYELDLYDTYSPYETHIGQGQGHANITAAGGLVWITKNWGVSGKVEDTGYSVTQVSKTALMVLGGVTTRQYFLGFPTRFNLGYAQQVNNGIINGVETSQMHAVYLGMDVRTYCSDRMCVRLQEQFELGRVLEQGNPVCDGTLGPVPAVLSCPRTSAIGAGVSLNVLFEFHRRNKKVDPYALY